MRGEGWQLEPVLVGVRWRVLAGSRRYSRSHACKVAVALLDLVRVSDQWSVGRGRVRGRVRVRGRGRVRG